MYINETCIKMINDTSETHKAWGGGYPSVNTNPLAKRDKLIKKGQSHSLQIQIEKFSSKVIYKYHVIDVLYKDLTKRKPKNLSEAHMLYLFKLLCVLKYELLKS